MSNSKKSRYLHVGNNNILYYIDKIYVTYRIKGGFHMPTKPADERQKSADLWDFEKIFGRCNRFAKWAD